MPAKLLFLCLLLQTGIALKQKTTTKPTMEVHGVVPDVIDVAPTAKIQVNQYFLLDFVFYTQLSSICNCVCRLNLTVVSVWMVVMS